MTVVADSDAVLVYTVTKHLGHWKPPSGSSVDENGRYVTRNGAAGQDRSSPASATRPRMTLDPYCYEVWAMENEVMSLGGAVTMVCESEPVATVPSALV